MPVVSRENITMQVDQLQPYPKNARTHSDYQIKQLADFIKQVGYIDPIIIDETDMILAGHGRALAALKADINSVPCVRISGLTESEKRAYIIADNKLALNAGWDDDLLKAELDDLMAIGDIDISVIGFTDDELKIIDIDFDQNTNNNNGHDNDPDDIPEVEQNVYGVERGDVWQLGRHRLMCGDSTSQNDVDWLMDGNIANIMMTDPPYGVKLDQSWRDAALGDKAMGKGNAKKIQNDDIADWTSTYQLFNGNIAYVWHASKYSDIVMDGLRSSGLEICQQLIWNKSIMVMGRSDYHFKHEPCWYAVRKGKTHDWIGDRKQTTVIDAASPNHLMSGSKEDKTEHPTQKPITCMMLFKNHSGDVYDPFLGSGSTLIACEKTGRKCYGMELDPHYCSVIIKRYEIFSGDKAFKL